MRWYYAIGDKKRGPLSDDQLQALVNEGVITRATMIRGEGMAEWAPYGECDPTTPPAPTAELKDGIVCGKCGCAISTSDSFMLSDVSYCLACKPHILQRLAQGRGITEPVGGNRIIHRVALVSLSFVAARSIIGAIQQFRFSYAPKSILLMTILFGLALWSLLLWKIWKRPRKWGLGVGILLILMVAFQSYLWWSGLHSPALAKLDLNRSTTHFILKYELPIFIAGVSCALLRFFPPK